MKEQNAMTRDGPLPELARAGGAETPAADAEETTRHTEDRERTGSMRV